MQEAIDFASRTKTIEPCEFWASIGSASRTETVQPLYWYKSTLGSSEHIVHIDGVVGSSPTVTTTNPVGVQVQRLPDFFAYPYWLTKYQDMESVL